MSLLTRSPSDYLPVLSRSARGSALRLTPSKGTLQHTMESVASITFQVVLSTTRRSPKSATSDIKTLRAMVADRQSVSVAVILWP
jgi:hypothetical protein